MKLPKIKLLTKIKLLLILKGITLVWLILLVLFWLVNTILVIWHNDWSTPPFQRMFFVILIPLIMRWKLIIKPYDIEFEVTSTNLDN